MKMPKSERRHIENEMIFRRMNEKVSDDIEALDAMHIEDGNPDLISDADAILHFRCECSDEKCDDRIQLRLTEYQTVHINRDTFIIKHGHQLDSIEKIIKETKDYSIVKKNNSTAEPSDKLNKSKINNSKRR